MKILSKFPCLELSRFQSFGNKNYILFNQNLLSLIEYIFKLLKTNMLISINISFLNHLIQFIICEH